MDRHEDWQMIKKVGSVVPIAKGSDSTVHSFTRLGESKPSSVVKLYDKTYGLSAVGDIAEVKKVLQEYYTDTIRAKKKLEKNPNPLGQQIIIGRKLFDLSYKIIPQGDVILEEDAIDSNDPNSLEETRGVLFGQEFVAGLNLHSIATGLMDGQVDPEQKIFVNNRPLWWEIETLTRDLFHYLSKSVGAHFVFHEMNIKPFIKNDGVLLVVITDLAGGLVEYDRQSAKLKAANDSDNTK